MVLQVLDVVNETRVEVACPTRSGRSLPVPHSSALPAHSRAVLGASADEGEGQPEAKRSLEHLANPADNCPGEAPRPQCALGR